MNNCFGFCVKLVLFLVVVRGHTDDSSDDPDPADKKRKGRGKKRKGKAGEEREADDRPSRPPGMQIGGPGGYFQLPPGAYVRNPYYNLYNPYVRRIPYVNDVYPISYNPYPLPPYGYPGRAYRRDSTRKYEKPENTVELLVPKNSEESFSCAIKLGVVFCILISSV